MTREAPEIVSAYAEHDREIALRRIRIGCGVAIIVLPLGSLIDLLLYRSQVLPFLGFRCLGSLAMLPLLGLVHTRTGRQHHAALASPSPSFPRPAWR